MEVSLVYTTSPFDRTDILIRVRNLQGFLGSIPWAIEGMDLRNLATNITTSSQSSLTPSVTTEGMTTREVVNWVPLPYDPSNTSQNYCPQNPEDGPEGLAYPQGLFTPRGAPGFHMYPFLHTADVAGCQEPTVVNSENHLLGFYPYYLTCGDGWVEWNFKGVVGL